MSRWRPHEDEYTRSYKGDDGTIHLEVKVDFEVWFRDRAFLPMMRHFRREVTMGQVITWPRLRQWLSWNFMLDRSQVKELVRLMEWQGLVKRVGCKGIKVVI